MNLLRHYLHWFNTQPTWMLYQQRNNLGGGDSEQHAGASDKRPMTDVALSPLAQNPFPVPVLAELMPSCDGNQHGQTEIGEARESTDTKLKRSVEQVASEPRGGENTLLMPSDLPEVGAHNSLETGKVPGHSPRRHGQPLYPRNPENPLHQPQ